MHREVAGPPTALFGLAVEQRGLITRVQLARAVPSEHRRRRLVDEGWLHRIRPGVYSVGGHQPSPWDVAVAALLAAGPGAVLSHRTAAQIHRFPGLRTGTGPPELTVVAPRHPELSGVTVHRVVHLDQRDVTGRPPLIFTTAARTVVDLAPRIAPGLLAAIVDEGTVAGLWRVDDLRCALERVAPRARVGLGVLGAIIEARRGEPRAESLLERRVIRALAPLAPFVTQHQVVLDGQVAIVDIAWPDRLVGVEVDGFTTHGRTRSRFDADRFRDNRLAAHGWRIVHVTSNMDDETIRDAVGRVLCLARPVVDRPRRGADRRMAGADRRMAGADRRMAGADRTLATERGGRPPRRADRDGCW